MGQKRYKQAVYGLLSIASLAIALVSARWLYLLIEFLVHPFPPGGEAYWPGIIELVSVDVLIGILAPACLCIWAVSKLRALSRQACK